MRMDLIATRAEGRERVFDTSSERFRSCRASSPSLLYVGGPAGGDYGGIHYGGADWGGYDRVF